MAAGCDAGLSEFQAALPPPPKKGESMRLCLKVVSARDLPSRTSEQRNRLGSLFPSPFCVLEWKGQKLSTSSVLRSLNPRWHDELWNLLLEPSDLSTTLTLQVWDKGVDNDPIGIVKLKLYSLPRNQPKDLLLQLEQGRGKVRVYACILGFPSTRRKQPYILQDQLSETLDSNTTDCSDNDVSAVLIPEDSKEAVGLDSHEVTQVEQEALNSDKGQSSNLSTEEHSNHTIHSILPTLESPVLDDELEFIPPAETPIAQEEEVYQEETLMSLATTAIEEAKEQNADEEETLYNKEELLDLKKKLTSKFGNSANDTEIHTAAMVALIDRPLGTKRLEGKPDDIAENIINDYKSSSDPLVKVIARRLEYAYPEAHPKPIFRVVEAVRAGSTVHPTGKVFAHEICAAERLLKRFVLEWKCDASNAFVLDPKNERLRMASSEQILGAKQLGMRAVHWGRDKVNGAAEDNITPSTDISPNSMEDVPLPTLRDMLKMKCPTADDEQIETALAIISDDQESDAIPGEILEKRVEQGVLVLKEASNPDIHDPLSVYLADLLYKAYEGQIPEEVILEGVNKSKDPTMIRQGFTLSELDRRLVEAAQTIETLTQKVEVGVVDDDLSTALIGEFPEATLEQRDAAIAISELALGEDAQRDEVLNLAKQILTNVFTDDRHIVDVLHEPLAIALQRELRTYDSKTIHCAIMNKKGSRITELSPKAFADELNRLKSRLAQPKHSISRTVSNELVSALSQNVPNAPIDLVKDCVALVRYNDDTEFPSQAVMDKLYYDAETLVRSSLERSKSFSFAEYVETVLTAPVDISLIRDLFRSEVGDKPLNETIISDILTILNGVAAENEATKILQDTLKDVYPNASTKDCSIAVILARAPDYDPYPSQTKFSQEFAEAERILESLMTAPCTLEPVKQHLEHSVLKRHPSATGHRLARLKSAVNHATKNLIDAEITPALYNRILNELKERESVLDQEKYFISDSGRAKLLQALCAKKGRVSPKLVAGAVIAACRTTGETITSFHETRAESILEGLLRMPQDSASFISEKLLEAYEKEIFTVQGKMEIGLTSRHLTKKVKLPSSENPAVPARVDNAFYAGVTTGTTPPAVNSSESSFDEAVPPVPCLLCTPLPDIVPFAKRKPGLACSMMLKLGKRPPAVTVQRGSHGGGGTTDYSTKLRVVLVGCMYSGFRGRQQGLPGAGAKVRAMRRSLLSLGISESNMKVLGVGRMARSEAEFPADRRNILDSIDWLVDNNSDGAPLFFYFTGWQASDLKDETSIMLTDDLQVISKGDLVAKLNHIPNTIPITILFEYHSY